MVFPIVVIRPDNTQTISKLAEFLINPNLNYIKAVDYNIYYLVSNKYLVIEYKAENKNSKLIIVECNSYGLTMWEVKTKYTIETLGPIGSGG